MLKKMLPQLIMILCAMSLAACFSQTLSPSALPQPLAAATPTQIPTASAASGFDAASNASGFTLSSAEVVDGDTLPIEYTCDGASATLPLAWSGAPAGTISYAVVMHHVTSPDDVHWYWVLYDIPADVTSLAKNSTGIGMLGNNSVK